MTRQELIDFITQNYTELDQLNILLDIFSNMMDAINLNDTHPEEQALLNKLDAAYCLLNTVRNEVTKR